MIATAQDYRDRIAALHATKLKQTRDKLALRGSIDGDDHGWVLPPADFDWEPTPNHPCGEFYGFDGCGKNFRSLLEAMPTYVDANDALAGRLRIYFGQYRKHHWRPGAEFDYSHLMLDQRRYGIVSGIGGGQHFGPDLRIGLELGWGGLLEKIRRYRKRHGPDKQDFFQGEEDVVLGTQDWIRRTVADIRAAEEKETDPDLKANLHEMAAANEWLIDGAPRTLREACQWIAWFGMIARMYNGDGAGEQLDELLRPYYERDLAAGTIDDDTAIYYIACLLLNDAKYYQLSGPAPDGSDLTSRVSYLILDAARRMGIPCNLTVRVHDKMDQEFFREAVRCLAEQRQGWPRFASDKGLVEGFIKNGYSRELARQRIAVGCHWFAIPGREYTLNDIVKINLGRVLEMAMWEMLDDPDTTNSVDTLWQRFGDHLHRAIIATGKGMDFQLAHMKDYIPELVLDLFCHGTIEQGLDATDGGVEYYNLCIDGSALATVADSFAAVEQRIEREKVLTWEQFAEHLRDNYAGTDGERVRLMMNTSQRYGAGGSLGDEWALKISRRFTREVKDNPTPEGRNTIPGFFSWSNTITMGACLAATPNGRRAGEPISHGANPHPGFCKDGALTAMVKAIASIQPGWGNTAPVQMEVDPAIFHGESGAENIATLIKTHFDLGGTLFNINVFDKDMVLEAHEDPAKYPDLVVRVTGFSAYFASLSRKFRQLVVDRILAG